MQQRVALVRALALGAPLLEVENLSVFYGSIEALRGVSLRVDEGEVVTLIGANGAGKSTTLRTISGLIEPKRGSIQFAGQAIQGWAPHRVVKCGLVQVPEGREIFANLTVDENLQLANPHAGFEEIVAVCKIDVPCVRVGPLPIAACWIGVPGVPIPFVSFA